MATEESTSDAAATRRVDAALRALRDGECIVLRPRVDRGLPPFLVVAADRVTAPLIGDLTQAGQGQLYLALGHDQCERLGLEMASQPTPASYNQLDSIDARVGIGSGLSADDRAHTIRLAGSPAASAPDFVKPGHVVPLQAAPHGVLERPGPTEGAVDLVRACGLGEGAVIAPLLEPTAADADMVEVTVDDVIAFRWHAERLVQPATAASIPTPHGDFRVIAFRDAIGDSLYLAFVHGDPAERREVLISAHRECLLGSTMHGSLCRCAERLGEAIGRTVREGGILLFAQVPQAERRENPLAACPESLRADEREAPAAIPAAAVAQILGELKVESVRWLGVPPSHRDIPIVSSEPYTVDAEG